MSKKRTCLLLPLLFRMQCGSRPRRLSRFWTRPTPRANHLRPNGEQPTVSAIAERFRQTFRLRWAVDAVSSACGVGISVPAAWRFCSTVTCFHWRAVASGSRLPETPRTRSGARWCDVERSVHDSTNWASGLTKFSTSRRLWTDH